MAIHNHFRLSILTSKSKANRLEIYNTSCEGLSLAHTKTIYGKIIMLQKLHPPSSPTDHLFIGTDRSTYFTVSWDAKAKQLRTEKSYVDQGNKKGRDAYTNDKCLIDPTKRFMVLELFEGVLTVIPIAQKSKKKSDVEIGTLGEPISARIPELAIRSSAFLAPQNLSADREKPRIALLYRTNDERARLKLRSLEYAAGGTGEPGSAEFEAIDGLNDILSPGASHLIPVPAPARGVLIIAETSITYFNDHSKETLEEPLSKATIFSCWTQIDEQRYLLADIYGELYLLMLVLSEDGEVVGWNLDTLGKTSSASVLVYLDGGCVLIGSHQGDSQVIKIQEKAIEVVQTIPNIAPVLDFTIMDMGSRAGEAQTNEYSSGQARIVTGSGAFDDGSLRSVRSGVGLEELGSLGEMDHITELFSIRSAIGSVATNTLVVSFIDETRIFLFDAEGNVEEVEEHQGLLTSEGTLLASNLTNNRVLQVTKLSVTVSDLESGMLISGWSPPDEQTITAVSVSHDHLLLSAGGTEAFVLDISGNLQIIVQKTLGAENQIACVNVPSMFPDICIVGFWQSGVVKILDTKTLEVMKTAIVSKDAASIPRSVLLTQLLPDQLPTLFVALADGNVITFSVDPTTFQLSARKSIVLGTQQANFRELPRGNGLFNVFATCEHPSLIYGAEGRMIYSAVTAENASCICAFDSEAYPGAIAIATPEDLKIALVDPERTTHVQTLPIKQTVRRIAYSTRLKAFGMGTIDRRLVENVEIVQSHFKLVDEVIFSELDTYNLKEDELVESVIRADLNEGSGKLVERFVVGTAYISDKSPDTLRGRILVFEVTHDRKLKLVTELAVRGACRALGVVDGKIVAAMIKTVCAIPCIYPDPLSAFTYITKTYSSGCNICIRIWFSQQNCVLQNYHSPYFHLRHRLSDRNSRPYEVHLNSSLHSSLWSRRNSQIRRSRPPLRHRLVHSSCERR